MIINSVGRDVNGAGGRESPAEAAAVSSEETKQLFAAIQGCLIIHCSRSWLYSSLPSLFSPRLGEPRAFHLGAMTQGLCHLCCFPSGLSISFCVAVWSMIQCQTQKWDKNSYPSGFDQIFFLNGKHSRYTMGRKMKRLVWLSCPLCSFVSVPSTPLPGAGSFTLSFTLLPERK